MNYLKLVFLGLVLHLGACTEFNTNDLLGGKKDKKELLRDLSEGIRNDSFINDKTMLKVVGVEYFSNSSKYTIDFTEPAVLKESINSLSKSGDTEYCVNIKFYNELTFSIADNEDLLLVEDFACGTTDWYSFAELDKTIEVPEGKIAIINVLAKLADGKYIVFDRLFMRWLMDFQTEPMTCSYFISYYLWGGTWVVLNNDIDCTGEDFSLSREAEMGMLHIIGNGHVVKNINISKDTCWSLGMLGKAENNSYISNLGIETAVMQAGCDVGVLFGKLEDSLIENVYLKGAELNTGNSAGGLLGLVKHSSLRKINIEGVVVNGGNLVGGLGALIEEESRIDAVTVKESTVIAPGYHVGGIVGVLNDSEISNSKAEDTEVEGGANVGGLIGLSENSTIRGSKSSGTVHATTYNDVYSQGTGGLVGSAINTSITYSSSSSTVSAEYGSNNTGGLVGFMQEFSHVDYSSASGAVSSLDRHVGGLIGYLYNDSYDEQTHNVSNSHANGSVTGKFIIGGLIARADATIIEKVYATGKVTSNYVDSNGYVGGLIGRLVDGELYDSYATGHVEACTLSTAPSCKYVGGLIGTASGSIYDPKIFNSYALGSVVGTEFTGALVGIISDYSIFNGGYATRAVTGSGQYVGGVFGYRSPNADVENIYSLYPDTSAGVTVLTEAEFGEEASFVGFDFSSGWVMQGRMRCIDIRRPHLYWEPPYNSRFACAVMD